MVSTDSPVLEAVDVRKSFTSGGKRIEVLDGVDLRVAEGEYVAVMGPSGSGKSTLLYTVSGLEPADSGNIALAGTALNGLGVNVLADMRRRLMGFVFQEPTLLQDLTLLDNVVLTSALDRVGTPQTRLTRAQQLMTRAGIWDLRDRMTSEVSGGQLQRAGICRALMRQPRILFADEPTGALNSRSATEIMDLLGELHADGTTVLVVTHDPNVAARADRVIFMTDGRVADEVSFDDHGRDPAGGPVRADRVRARMAQLAI